MVTWIEELKEYKLNQGVLIQGLPGIGFAGKIAVDYVIQELRLQKVAELYSSHLTLPTGSAGVFITDDGLLKIPRYEFYFYSGNRDLLFLTSDVQPVSWGQYEVAEKLLQYFKEKGGVEVAAVCGTTIGEEGKKEVYYAADNEETGKWLQTFGVKPSIGGTITGACGLVPAVASKMGLKAYALMASTTLQAPDPEAGREIVKVLMKIYDFKVSLENLDKVIEEIKKKEQEVRQLAEKMRQARERRPEYYV